MVIAKMSTRSVTRTPELTADVEALFDRPEADGVYRESEKCLGLLLLAGAALLSPPTPRRKG
jgi:hypothetical protein